MINTDEDTPDVINLGTRTVPVTALMPHPHNPNRGDMDAIRASIRANGFWGSVIARQISTDDGSGLALQVLAGWHRAQAALAEGITEVPVTMVGADDVTAVRILLADNETGRRGRYAQDVLDGLLESLEDLDGTGFEWDLEGLDPDPEPDPEPEPDSEPEIPDQEQFITEYGLVLVFDSEAEQMEAYDAIVALGYHNVRVAAI